MRPWNTWLYGLGLSGALALGLAGCGGGDVPDPSSDELAADEGGDAPSEPSLPPPPVAPAAAPAPAGDAIAAPAAGAAPVATASAPGDAPIAPAVAPPGTPPVAQESTTAAPAADAQAAAKSETAELLAAASGAAAPASAVADAPAAGSPAGPGAPGAEPDAGMLAFPGGANPAALNGPGGEAAARGAFGPNAPGGDRDGSLGMPILGGGGGASELKPGDTNTPQGAVEAFLYALSKKDRDRLQEATALRSTTVEEGGKFRELFSRILDLSISESELDDLASKLEGYRNAGENQVKSTGRLGVTIRKQLKDGGWLQRTVTVRKEKKGWGVLDISGATEFDSMRVRSPQRRR